MRKAAAVLAILLIVPAVTAVASTARKIMTFSIGCSDRDMHKKLVSFAVARDVEAFGKLAAAGIATGVCRTFDQGDDIFVEDVSIFSGVVCARPKGDIACYWLQIESVSEK